MSKRKMQPDRWMFWRDSKKRWWWKLSSPNGRQVGGATESYTRRFQCEKNAARHGWTKEKPTEWVL